MKKSICEDYEKSEHGNFCAYYGSIPGDKLTTYPVRVFGEECICFRIACQSYKKRCPYAGVMK